MDYEKKLRETLLDETADYEVVRWIEREFPGLRESEDEQTRKWIVNLLHELHYNQTAQPMALKAIEYLEKQKECFANNSKTSASEDERIRKEIKDIILSYRSNCVSEGNHHFDECLAYLEKQKEQKPADTAFEIRLMDCMLSAQQYRQGSIDWDIVKPWAEELSGLIEQPNKEWSEEDNIGWDEAFACVTRAEKAAKNEEELQNAVTAEKWLKEIKFKYYVHPVKREWSEEDEAMIKSILWVLESYVSEAECESNPSLTTTYPTYYEEIDWLKSLRPDSYKNCNSR